ncbi:hypothetical protein OESDEN_13418 [Oesophagostomum dentatum]|uniref:NUP160 middle TPR domain-containing protein n=1 Tax=Oesophagostomum dentatum TaxID=61180 RepID=A0A0B1STG1_OESDE|nr:hypothetical protein OESDEN_13418 [Oesophagostomum dentatum]
MKYSTLMKLCTLYGNSTPEELRSVMTFYSAIAYSGIGKPLKAMTNFNLAAKGITEQNKAMMIALSPVGRPSQEVNLGDYYVTALRYLHEHRHSEEVVEMARTAVESLPSGHECTDQEVKKMTLRRNLYRVCCMLETGSRLWNSLMAN